jgi:type IV fimbrial biogenesis protein FimT
MRRSPGFTLIELMVTIVVLAILVALAIPSFSTFFEKSRLRSAADDLVSLISTVRMEATKTNRDVTLSVNRTSAAVWCVGANQVTQPAVTQPIVFSDTGCDCTSASATACTVDGTRRVVDSSAYRGVTIAAADNSKKFGIDGQYGVTLDPANPTTTTLCTETFNLTSSSGNYQVTLKVSPMGQTQVCIPAGATFISGSPSCATTTSTACS